MGELAKELKLQVELVRVSRFGFAYHGYVGTFQPGDVAALQMALEEEIADYLKAIAKKFEDQGIKVSWQLLKRRMQTPILIDKGDSL